jgi:hypothetical protein
LTKLISSCKMVAMRAKLARALMRLREMLGLAAVCARTKHDQ